TTTTRGNYKCRVTKTATGCYKNSNTIAVSVPCKEGLPAGEAGLPGDEPGEMINNEILIYPNPANSNINIETSNNNSKEIVIYDAIGNVIISHSSSAYITQIPIDMLSSGIYFIQVVDGEYSNMNNFVKQ
ncbi:MAG TPA: T9SS type A sorting domain-containing protein, partial [Chitinophagales bacterium]|nr:T9SS type A sorting domain-containing protein [Chitinophagales bacterium]